MYVGGLEAAAGSARPLVGKPPTDAPAHPASAHHETITTAPVLSAAAPGAPGVARRPGSTRRRQPAAVLQLIAIDVVAVGAAFAIAFMTRFGMENPGFMRMTDLASALLLPVAWLLVAALNRAYDPRFTGVGTNEFGRVFRTFLHTTVLTALLSFAARLELARGFILIALPLALLLSWVGRYLARWQLHRMRRAGCAMNRVLAVGSARSVRAIAVSMRGDISAGLHVVGACLPADEVGDVGVRAALLEAGIAVLGDVDSVREAAGGCEAASVAVVAGDVGTEALRSIAWQLEGSGADLIVSSGLPEVAGRRVHVQSVAGLPLLRIDEPAFRGVRRVVKGAFDRTAAALALLILSPVFLVLVALIRLTSRGPAFFRQTRVGRHGRRFRMVKFRSMRLGADGEIAALAGRNEAADGLLFKIRDDPRVTTVGRLLRRFSLDELPQLINVLTGSMSLVGPRPPLPSEVERYGRDVRRRLLVKPGLTGLWQVSGRSDLSWEDSVRLDLNYVENWSIALDMVVLLRTARVVVKATGAY